MRKDHKPEPRVGIFWLHADQLIFDSTPLSRAERYGNSLTHATGHVDYWSVLQQGGLVPYDLEYDQPPRGRVAFDTREQRFFLRADRCILRKRQVVRRIMIALHLPPDLTATGRDDHYRCTVCLNRERRQSQER
jgi:hypothetical protein